MENSQRISVVMENSQRISMVMANPQRISMVMSPSTILGLGIQALMAMGA